MLESQNNLPLLCENLLDSRPSLPDVTPDQLQTLLVSWGRKPSHAGRILRDFYQRGILADVSTDAVGPAVRELLLRHVRESRSRVAEERTSGDGTIKLLIAMERGGAVESVLMPGYRDQSAAGCISSQIGCAMGCDFCASTREGLERNLEAGEIIEQFLHLKRAALGLGRNLKTLVFMGMGEPMHNLPNVIEAVKRIAHPDVGGLGWRQITISTVGIIPGIDALAQADLNVHLALSLHAPDDATRSKLVPSNRRYPIAEILAAAKRFYLHTRRVVTIEYCLLAGVNDSDVQADLLAKQLEGFRAHVNLIPYNSIGAGLSGTIYQRPSVERVNQFLQRLRIGGAVSHVRDTRGDDVWAACGQLRQAEIHKPARQTSTD